MLMTFLPSIHLYTPGAVGVTCDYTCLAYLILENGSRVRRLPDVVWNEEDNLEPTSRGQDRTASIHDTQ